MFGLPVSFVIKLNIIEAQFNFFFKSRRPPPASAPVNLPPAIPMRNLRPQASRPGPSSVSTSGSLRSVSLIDLHRTPSTDVALLQRASSNLARGSSSSSSLGRSIHSDLHRSAAATINEGNIIRSLPSRFNSELIKSIAKNGGIALAAAGGMIEIVKTFKGDEKGSDIAANVSALTDNKNVSLLSTTTPPASPLTPPASSLTPPASPLTTPSSPVTTSEVYNPIGEK